MSQLIDLEWDSQLFGGRTARIDNYSRLPDHLLLSGYKYVHVRVPQEEVELIWQYQKIGFRYITTDYSLEKMPAHSQPSVVGDYKILVIHKEVPTFVVSGFQLTGSRLFIDPQLRQHLDERFWDRTICDHCRDFADFALCAVNNQNHLIGFISCFDRADAIDMFLVIVHRQFRGRGIGRVLLNVAEACAFDAGKRLTTSVVSHNLTAMNFYAKNAFFLKNANVILHYSTNRDIHV